MRHRRLPRGINAFAFGSVVLLLFLVPVARIPGPELPGLTTAFGTLLFVTDLAIAYLLLSRFHVTHGPGDLVLSGAYSFSALMSMVLLLSFPDALSRAPVLATSPQSAAWFFHLWVAGFASLVLAAVIVAIRWGDRPVPARFRGGAGVAVIAGAALMAVAVTCVVLLSPTRLPALVDGPRWTTLNYVLVGASMSVVVLSIALIHLRLSSRDEFFAWLASALSIFLAANVLSAWSGGRYTLGWTTGRLYWAISFVVLFIFFLREIASHQRALAEARDQLEAKVAERTAELQLLMNELNHRVKNTLATVQAIAARTLRDAGVGSAVRDALESRLLALSTAHNTLSAEGWDGADMGQIIRQAVSPHASPDRFSLSGPAISLAAKPALAIAMGMHELATNAVKYGAWSNQTGRVAIEWSADPLAPTRFSLTWRERGGPEVAAPSGRGFGSRLIERNLAGDVDGSATIAFGDEGVVCTIVGSVGSPPPTKPARR